MIPKLSPVIISPFGPPALACIRSWGRQGFRVGMVCIRSEEEADPDCRFLASFISLHPNDVLKPEGIRAINDFIKAFGASGIISINEDITCWLNDNRGALDSRTAIWASSNEAIHSVLSKQKQLDVARAVGFDLLPTYFIDRDPAAIQRIQGGHFPLCLRPDHPKTITPSFKVQIVSSPAELVGCVERLSRLDASLIAQPLESLPNLVVHGARKLNGDQIGLHAFLVERKFQGVTLTIRATQLEDGLRAKCVDFVDRFHLTGSYHFEFLLDRNSGKTYFLEINSRLGGTTAKVLACGYDEPLLALEAYGACEGRPQDVRDCIVSSKHALLKYCCHTLKNRLTLLDYPDESKSTRLLKSLYGFLCFKDEILTFRDIRGSLAFYRALLR
ncbi:MAG: hypothetical protein H6Q04_3492 [Acidobacteria bacterium]|nr:hypothetical protein [Acidobacteriota bacterium]